jgi:Lrp/AsnC family transcriptional regulator for asnA, asnC and gidA
MKIDELDLKIVELLKKNGRIQNSDIAEKLAVSEGTIRNRMKKLFNSNFLTVKGLVNPDMIKEKQIFFLGVSMQNNRNMEEAVKTISQFKEVRSIYMVTGRYDFLIEIFIESHKLIHFLSNGLASVNGAGTTESYMVLKTYNKWVEI